MSKPMTRTLVVDDEPINRMLVADLLSDHGLECDEANDGPTGLAMIRAGTYFLAFLDISMPGMDGAAVCKAIREDSTSNNVYLVAYTAHAYANQLEKFRSMGFDGVLAKPVSLEELTSVVTQAKSRKAT